MRRAAVVTGLLVTAAVVAFACVAVSSWKPAPQVVRYAWFCRVWTEAPPVTATAMCEQHPASYKPPWPYLGESGKVHYPAPSASPARGG